MITAGVDLATEPWNTALATVEWSSARASILSLSHGVDDASSAKAAAGLRGLAQLTMTVTAGALGALMIVLKVALVHLH